MSWLQHEAVLAVQGIDAAKFLQGQITCDVLKLPEPGSVLGARCTPKGRMQSSFRLLREDQQTYLLAMDAELLAAQLAELGKYAVFFKTKLSDASQHWVRLGLWGEQAEAALQQVGLTPPATQDAVTSSSSGLAVNLGQQCFELWLPVETALPSIRLLANTASPTSLAHWRLQQIRRGAGEVCAATSESFIPQMLNLQLFDGVSFKKGCYTGQEIVARMQYLGKLKRRMFRFRIDASAPPPSAGTPILNNLNGQSVGEVVLSASDGEATELLAVMQIDAAQLTTLCAGEAQGPMLELVNLPYDSELAASEAATEH
ncbi:MAG: YgfZ/GcvT domain-containing protein [Pseudomonas sp.]